MDQLRPDAIKAVVQRSLLSWWERRRGARVCPPVEALLDEAIDWARPDILTYAVEHSASGVDYRVVHHGTELFALYDGDVTGTTLREHIIVEHQAPILAAYDEVCQLRRPIYSVRASFDSKGLPVRIETLRLPLVRPDDEVALVMTSVGAISFEGAFDHAAVQREARSGAYRVMGFIERLAPKGSVADAAVKTD